MKIAALIPARSGSKSLVHKNLRTVGGKSLIARAVEACIPTACYPILFSTDSELYWQEAKRAFDESKVLIDFPGRVPPRLQHIHRPPELAEDVPSEGVVIHALQSWEHGTKEILEIVCTIQATTPFISPPQIQSCIDLLTENPEAQSCITVRKVKEHPDWIFWKRGGYLETITGLSIADEVGVRQHLTDRFIPTGGCYATRVEYLMQKRRIIADRTLFVEVPQWQGFDIDDDLDIEIAECLSKRFGLFGLPR